jgi:hypothetical protein
MGRAPDDLAAEMLRLIGQQADAPPPSARLKVVGTGNSSFDSALGSSLENSHGSSSAGKEKQR